ncbi:MAG: Integrator complex subunit 11, variant 3 [Marteilia pararefringens]
MVSSIHSSGDLQISNQNIQIVPLGAGQDVGRSCIIVNILNKRIMLDCGMHMGHQSLKKFPDFKFITGHDGDLTKEIDCVIVSHFHLDHCGALPYLTEMVGYSGPIYMTNPTKAICPIQLEDMRKISNERKKDDVMFTSEMINKCMLKTTGVNLHQTIQVDDRITIRAHYAGHVLGAAMFEVHVDHLSFVYTGDYNMTADRHLGPAQIDCIYPDFIITESTYATTIRDSKYCRERDFLKKLTNCIKHGGKVLIPVFALGRAHEIFLLLENYWERMNLKVPIYYSGGITDKSLDYYKLFVNWMNQKIKRNFFKRNAFNFRHIKPMDSSHPDMPGPMVIIATPGMLNGGTSLQILKKWCTNPNNLLMIIGYCVKGTLGHKILNERSINLDPGNPDSKPVEIKIGVEYLSFSAHADAKGIMQLIGMCCPKNVVLVHGEASKMEFIKQKIFSEFRVPCFMPDNGEILTIKTQNLVPIDLDYKLYKQMINTSNDDLISRKFKGIMHFEGDSEVIQIDQINNYLERKNLPTHNFRITVAFNLPKSLHYPELLMLINNILIGLQIKSNLTNLQVDKMYNIRESIWFKIQMIDKNISQITVHWSLIVILI